jgi:kynurenine formamidase
MAADLERWKHELSNWGRWGKDDEIGALNLITPAKRKQAAALVREGVSVSLSRDADQKKDVDNPSPYERTMTGIGGDTLNIRFHGYAHTHLDSLAHVYDGGKGYNGYTPDESRVMKEGGHAKNSVYGVHTGIFTRGILMDIPRLKGVPYLEPGTHIYPEDLEAWEKRAGVKVSAGDALFIRTGRWTRREKQGPWEITKNMAGLDASCLPWLKQRDIALLSGESPQDAVPVLGDLTGLPVHNFVLIYLGVQLIDNASLDAVAEAAAARNRWEFLFTTAPLALRGGTGSPVNPIATF